MVVPVTERLGLFQQHGLDVTVTYIQSGARTAASVIAGDTPIAFAGGQPVIGTQLSGGDLVAVATFVPRFTYDIQVTPNIERPEQLRGGLIASSSRGGTADMALQYLAELWGMKLDEDLQVLATGGQPERLAALESGQVQAALVSELAGVDLRRRGYSWLLDLGALDAEYSHHGLTVTRTFLEERPDQARRFVRAVVQAMGQFVQDPAMAKRVLRRYTREHDPEVLEAVWQMHATRYLRRAPYTTPAAVQLLLEELAPRYSRALTADPAEFYDNTLVRELDESGFLASVY
jgi:ABC-type nitrate/sulfonate/bicarbonate transport system substrate-binding protein